MNERDVKKTKAEFVEDVGKLRNQVTRQKENAESERSKPSDDQSDTRKDILDAINWVFREALRCETREQVANACLKASEKLTGSKFGFICEVNRRERFDTIAISDTGWNACRIPGGHELLMANDLVIRGIRSLVVKEGRSIIFNDPSSHRDWIEPPEGHPRIRCFMGVPFKQDRKTVGMIGLANKEVGYTEGDRQIVEELSAAFLEALTHKRTEERLSRETERTRVLLDLYVQAPVLTDKELYDYALEKAVHLTESTIGFFHRIADDQKTVILTTWNREALESCTALYDSHYLVDNAGNWVDCIRMGRPIVYNDFAESPNRRGLPDGHATIKRFMSVPVIEGGKVRFIFGVGNKQTDYEDADVNHLGLVANELHKVMKQRAADEEIRKLNEELEQRVRERTAQLAAVNKELEAFAYSVSHDLRAPLRAIEGFSQALVEDYRGKLDEQGTDYLQRVSAESRRMAQLIDDLLKLSRITRSEIRTERVSLSGLFQEVAERLREAEPDRQVEISIAGHVSVIADPRLLRQVVENLLSNAWKFTGLVENARIEFGILENDDEKVFFVKDNGAGFDMKYADKLFSPFQRLHGMTEFPGTGIGLSTVQRIVSRHGGRVWCDSEVGRGAAFYFTLSQQGGSR